MIKIKNKKDKSFSKIWIIIIFLAVITGGILAWQYLKMQKEEVKVPEEIAKDETADWKTYTNEKYGFKIKYPTNFYFHEISPGNDTTSESMSFQEKERWEGAWEWSRFEVEIFQNDNLLLLPWLQEKWLEYDTPMDTKAFRKNFDQIIKQREEITINNYQAIKLPHSYDNSVYFLFVSNNGSSIAKLTCIVYGEDISKICHKAFTTFRFLE